VIQRYMGAGVQGYRCAGVLQVCKCTVILQVYNGYKISTVLQGTGVVEE